MQVQRVTLTGPQAVTFATKSARWLVKNLGDGDVYATIGETYDQDHAAKIPAGAAQVIMETEFPTAVTDTSDTIHLDGAGEVEVQQLCPEW